MDIGTKRKLLSTHHRILEKLGRSEDKAFSLTPAERKALQEEYAKAAPGVSDDASLVDFFESPRPQLFLHVIRVLNCGWLAVYYSGALTHPAKVEIVDIGAGKGELMNVIRAYPLAKGARITYTGLDMDIRKAELFGALYPSDRNNYLVHDFTEKLPMNNNSVDVAVCTEAIEHVGREEAVALVADIHRILKPGGHAIITTPDISNRGNHSEYHPYEWRSFELQEVMEKRRFEVVQKFWYAVPWDKIPMLNGMKKSEVDGRINSDWVRNILAPVSGSDKGGLVSFVVRKKIK